MHSDSERRTLSRFLSMLRPKRLITVDTHTALVRLLGVGKTQAIGNQWLALDTIQ